MESQGTNGVQKMRSIESSGRSISSIVYVYRLRSKFDTKLGRRLAAAEDSRGEGGVGSYS
jgi:hypothetical protein